MMTSIDQMREKCEKQAKAKLKKELEKRLIQILGMAKTPNLDEIEDLIKAGASLKAKSRELDICVVTLAACNGHIDAMRLLLKAGANPNGEKNHWGYTPLYFARKSNNWKMIDLLVEKGAKG